MQDVNLFISVPSVRDWKPQFGASICMLAEHLVCKKLDGRLAKVRYNFQMQSSCLSVSREMSLLYAEKEGFTHWLSLDDDMMFPSDIVERLISHDLPVVVANYRRKQKEVAGICIGKENTPINSSGKKGVEEIEWMGGGCNLFKIDAIKEIRPPRFSVLWVDETQSYMTEDYYFSLRLRDKGIKIFCDHDASKLVKHIGDYVYEFPRSGE